MSVQLLPSARWCLTGRCALESMSLTLPLPSAVACADALEQVSSVVLLAPGVSNPVGCPGVLIIASVCCGKRGNGCRIPVGDNKQAFIQTKTAML